MYVFKLYTRNERALRLLHAVLAHATRANIAAEYMGCIQRCIVPLFASPLVAEQCVSIWVASMRCACLASEWTNHGCYYYYNECSLDDKH